MSRRLLDNIFDTSPRQGLQPIPGTRPLSITAAILPPVLYYFALLLLAPPPPPLVDSIFLKSLRNTLAIISGFLFFRLALVYHVPQSIGLTYQLGLVSLYGGCRILDTFFISPYLFGHIPRRVHYHHKTRPSTPEPAASCVVRHWSDGGVKEPFAFGETTTQGSTGSEAETATFSTKSDFNQKQCADSLLTIDITTDTVLGSFAVLRRSISGPDPRPVYEFATTEVGWPETLSDRAAWALELELSMRGVGFTWTTADVRHTRKTWLPGVKNRLHSIVVHVLPVLLLSWVTVKHVYVHFLNTSADTPSRNTAEPFDDLLPVHVQLYLTAGLGAFLMTAFSLGHSIFAIFLSPLAPSPLAFFPPLYSRRIWEITSVRKFWSFGWHRLFARLFLVYGVWPGQWVERKLRGKRDDEPADIGKVLGGFLSSAFVHSFSVRGVLGGDWMDALGEAKFFTLNGLAVIFEEAVIHLVQTQRKQRGRQLGMWYDQWVGRVWWITVVLWTGRNFARGWVKANLVREMAFM